MKTVKQQTTKVKDYSPSATLGKNSKSETEGGTHQAQLWGITQKAIQKGIIHQAPPWALILLAELSIFIHTAQPSNIIRKAIQKEIEHLA